jgi:hypothetical protein
MRGRGATSSWLLTCLAATVWCMAGSHARAPVAVDTIAPPVCYALHVGSWRLLSPKGRVLATDRLEPEPWWGPPSRILLDQAPPTEAEKSKGWLADAKHAVRPSGVASPHWMFDVGSWKRESDGFVWVVWSGGYVVTSIKFPALTPNATGTLKVGSDDLSAPIPTTEVNLEQVPCRAEPG